MFEPETNSELCTMTAKNRAHLCLVSKTKEQALTLETRYASSCRPTGGQVPILLEFQTFVLNRRRRKKMSA